MRESPAAPPSAADIAQIRRRKITSADPKKITTQAVRKSGLRTHQLIQHADQQTKPRTSGLGSMKDADGCGGKRDTAIAAKREAGQDREHDPSRVRRQGHRVLQFVRELLKP